VDSLPRSISVSPSKEELFLAVVAEPCAQATASASAVSQAPVRARLRATIVAFCAWADANQDFARVLVRDGTSPTLGEIPDLVLRLLLEARLPAATTS